MATGNLLVVALAMTLLVTGCLSQSPSAGPVPTIRPPSPRDLSEFCDDRYNSDAAARNVCHDRVAIAQRTPGALADRDIWRYLNIDHEDVQWAEQDQMATGEAMDREYRATEGAEVATHMAQEARDGARLKATIEADYRNDAVRECIRAGYNETLCLLDPENPTLD